MERKIKIIGGCPNANPAEQDQFARVTKILANSAMSGGCEWAIIVRDIDYHHTAGKRIECDKDWNGQFDIVLLAADRIIIYELKGYTVDIYRKFHW